MAPNLEKARSDELAWLQFVLEKTTRKLDSAVGPEARQLSERQVETLQGELQNAIDSFERTSFAHINSLGNEDPKKAELKADHFQQIDSCDEALDMLYTLTKDMEAAKVAPTKPPEQSTTAAAKFEVNMLVSSLEARLAQLDNLSKEDSTGKSAPTLKAALQEVADIEMATSSNLSQATLVLERSALPQADRDVVLAQINKAAGDVPAGLRRLKMTFNQLLAQLTPPSPAQQPTPTASAS